MLLWPGFLAAATMHTRPIILSPDLVSVPRVKQMQTFVHALSTHHGSCEWTASSAVPSLLAPRHHCLQGEMHSTMLIFYGNNHQKSWNEKKKYTDYSSIITVIIIFVIIKCFHLCYQRGVTAPKCYSTSCWSPPWVSTFWRAVKNNQPKISEQERELGETNFHTVTEKEIFQKISFCLQRLLVVVERAFEWKRAKQP